MSRIEEVKKDIVSVISDPDLGKQHFLDTILIGAIKLSSSDVHISLFNKYTLSIDYRINGEIENIMKINKKGNGNDLNEVSTIQTFMQGFTTYIRTICQLKTDEINLPQDVALEKIYTLGEEKKHIKLRISLKPAKYGSYKIVFRILDRSNLNFDLAKIGLPGKYLKGIANLLLQPKSKGGGLVIMAGPTGSGKTTTLYSMLNYIKNGRKCSITTLEDPVEYEIDGVDQSEIKSHLGYTFSNGLRSILRQDPDVILVGEVRDNEVAHAMIEAASTGHLVLTTLHINEAVEFIGRLMGLGIEKDLILSQTNYIINQRLHRKLCPHCKIHLKNSDVNKDLYITSFLEKIGVDKTEKNIQKYLKDVYTINDEGCDKCDGTGIQGRIPVYEVLELNDEIKRVFELTDSKQDYIKLLKEKFKYKTLSDNEFLEVLGGDLDFKNIFI